MDRRAWAFPVAAAALLVVAGGAHAAGVGGNGLQKMSGGVNGQAITPLSVSTGAGTFTGAVTAPSLIIDGWTDPLQRRNIIKQWGQVTVPATGTTPLVCGSAALNGVSGTPTLTTNTTYAFRTITYTTGAVSGNQSGICNSSVPEFRTDGQSKYAVKVVLNADITAQRIWTGLSSTNHAAATTAAASTVVATMSYDIVFDPAVSANWRCCSGDGTTRTCTDIPSATATASAGYILEVDTKEKAVAVTCNVYELAAGSNGLSATVRTLRKTTNLPAANNTVYINACMTTLAAATHAFEFNEIEWQRN